MPVQYLDLADFLLIAEEVLAVRTEVLLKVTDLALADSAINAPGAEFGGVEFYPEFPSKVAVLCLRLIKNHPLPDGNKRVAYMCAVEFAERNGYEWKLPQGDEGDGTETVETLKAVAAGDLDEEGLTAWVGARLQA